MSAQERWISEFSKREDERVERLVEHAGWLFDQLATKLGVGLEDYRAPGQAGLWLQPDGMMVGAVADVSSDGAKVFVGTHGTAENARPAAYLAVIGPCRHCGADAPLRPYVLTEHGDSEAKGKLGLALMMRDPAEYHQCGPSAAPTLR